MVQQPEHALELARLGRAGIIDHRVGQPFLEALLGQQESPEYRKVIDGADPFPGPPAKIIDEREYRVARIAVVEDDARLAGLHPFSEKGAVNLPYVEFMKHPADAGRCLGEPGAR